MLVYIVISLSIQPLIGIINCVSCIRRGICDQNDNYTIEDPFKVGSLLLGLFGGELLFASLIIDLSILQMTGGLSCIPFRLTSTTLIILL